MIAALQVAERLSQSLTELFPFQYVMLPEGRDTAPLPGFTRHALAGSVLYHAPDLRVSGIEDRNGAPLGWFLGIGVDPDGQVIDAPLRLPVTLNQPDLRAAIDLWALGIGGRFAILLPVPEIAAAYQDPVGDLSMVYNPGDRMIGSTTLMAVPDGPFWHEGFDRKKVRQGKMNFSLQQCPDRRLLRMLPNHRLELTTFDCRRIWPREDTDLSVPEHGFEGNLARITERLHQILVALARHVPVALPISGGRDSRNLVGAFGAEIAEARFGFAWRFHKMSAIDQKVGGAIAARVGLPFEAVPHRRASKDDERLYFARTGYATGGGALRALGMLLDVPAGHVVLRGNVMELLRANQWNHATIQRGWVRPAFGFRRLLIEPEGDQEALRAAWLPKYEAWAATLPEAARARQLDLAFVEHLLPNTLGVRHWGDPGNFIMNPFADPELIRLAMQIPPERRDQDEPNRWLLENNCAHLADIPFEREVAVGAEVPEEEPD